MSALRALLEATTVDPNAAGMLYPVSPRSRAAQRAQSMLESGWDQDRVWDETGLTLSPDLDNTGVWLGPRSWADARMTTDMSEADLAGFNAGDLDAFVTGAPLPKSLRDRIQLILDPEQRGGGVAEVYDNGDINIRLGTERARLEPGEQVPYQLAHEAQHAVAYNRKGVPWGTSIDSARASRIVTESVDDKMPALKRMLADAEEAYWSDPTPANKAAMVEMRQYYDYALSNPEVIRDHAALSVYKRELGEALARWAEKNAYKSLADIRSGPAPFSALDTPLAKTLVRGEGLWGKYRDRRNNSEVQRLANFFKIATAMGGLGLSMGAVRQALQREMESEAT
jgi:hypothetical protein